MWKDMIYEILGPRVFKPFGRNGAFKNEIPVFLFPFSHIHREVAATTIEHRLPCFFASYLHYYPPFVCMCCQLEKWIAINLSVWPINQRKFDWKKVLENRYLTTPRKRVWGTIRTPLDEGLGYELYKIIVPPLFVTCINSRCNWRIAYKVYQCNNPHLLQLCVYGSPFQSSCSHLLLSPKTITKNPPTNSIPI